ncbi:MAG: 4-(cytidine 5'-diphospho)-2-C-methyl-D-erythritol kinase [Oscillospiraceae bacterium]|nr:4-(cytidine 5'-diphospho)-2-C-methyl-D-erythritol kinase [Oscillospiraceae bacterium]
MIITTKAYAKINLYLKILDKLPNGYHNIFTIMQRISLHDDMKINITPGEKIIKITCSDESIANEANTAYKAADLFLKNSNLPYDIDIEIEKHIPSQAGLGGGSSDAAAVLLALNQWVGNILPEDILMQIAANIGADVPFFVKNTSCAVCEGIGEIVAPFALDLSDYKVLIVKPAYNISTKQAFEDFDKARLSPILKGELDAELLKNFNVKKIYNDFAKLAYSQNESIEEIQKLILDYGAVSTELTGSGSALFGIFGDIKKAGQCAVGLKRLADIAFCGIFDFV